MATAIRSPMKVVKSPSIVGEITNPDGSDIHSGGYCMISE
jgi:hypothetical protein